MAVCTIWSTWMMPPMLFISVSESSVSTMIASTSSCRYSGCGTRLSTDSTWTANLISWGVICQRDPQGSGVSQHGCSPVTNADHSTHGIRGSAQMLPSFWLLPRVCQQEAVGYAPALSPCPTGLSLPGRRDHFLFPFLHHSCGTWHGALGGVKTNTPIFRRMNTGERTAGTKTAVSGKRGWRRCTWICVWRAALPFSPKGVLGGRSRDLDSQTCSF